MKYKFIISYFHVLKRESAFLSALDLGISSVGSYRTLSATLTANRELTPKELEKARLLIKQGMEESGHSDVTVIIDGG